MQEISLGGGGGMAQPFAVRRMRIALVGSGTAGPAAAILLARQGHEVVVYERAPDCRPVGAGFLLQPSGMGVLDELGILAPILRHGARVDRLHIMESDGRDLLDLRYQKMGEGRFGLGLHRPVLLHYLLEAAAEEGVPVHWGHEVLSAKRETEGWRLRFVEQEDACRFDLLLIGDGARSTLRDQLKPAAVNRGYPWGAHWFIGRSDGSFPAHELHQIVRGTRQLAGFLPTGFELGKTDHPFRFKLNVICSR
ncbi:2-polyprenyl-6-methoxyphenol hydroxylase-like FAD-dependent oxidoreductase [Haloferula luteola]|uniref:2-polyprenyl-6-methoxyphenol hydroxylase-like FAD-dependent oxidoreductase n=1 Tax=Haloferula luteola TaxID=595692 RepID=A0A840UYW0_9BACT|nr:NAD(P)/FAD-dependent oxidoreductase [Haloferula luteola]MBB5350925.1 2-polyprenyl-6-methoxyphenol hydroxylase-like FAD-dependent oxidoreductase [Haloferula luteola]